MNVTTTRGSKVGARLDAPLVGKAWKAGCLLLYGLAGLISAPAMAGPVTFTFDTVAGQDITGYMTSTLHSAGFGSSSATATGAYATSTYNGDGHVVGDTLGTSNGGVHHSGPNDGFIINNNQTASFDSFTLSFTNFIIKSISFDWEIFPDNHCSPTCTYHGTSWPDMELSVNGQAVTSAIWSMFAANVTDPQAIGSASLDLSGILGGVTSLTFFDWPSEVGVDNLVINGCALDRQGRITTCTPGLFVPEPSPLALMGLTLAVLALFSRRSRPRISQRQGGL